jgi:acyl-CoA synthetase (AMP-forming)/AMP-acid ligase II
MFCNKVDSSRRLGHYPIPESVEVKILAGNLAVPKDEVGLVGEICLRGRNVMSGYINNHAANREVFVDGFFRTGYLGVTPEGGYLQLTGRIKDILNKGGKNISPLEVENTGQSHELLRQVVCFKVLEESYSEDIGTR